MRGVPELTAVGSVMVIAIIGMLVAVVVRPDNFQTGSCVAELNYEVRGQDYDVCQHSDRR